MINLSPDSLRILAIMILGLIWFYLVIEQIAVNSTQKDDNEPR